MTSPSKMDKIFLQMANTHTFLKGIHRVLNLSTSCQVIKYIIFLVLLIDIVFQFLPDKQAYKQQVGAESDQLR